MSREQRLACRLGDSLRFVVMRVEWSTEDLVGSWTLVDEDWRLLGNKTGATRLGFALLLKFFELEARFPSGSEELHRRGQESVRESVLRADRPTAR